MRKSQKVFSHNGYKLTTEQTRSGTNKYLESPKGRKITRFSQMRLDWVQTPKGDARLTDTEWAARADRAGNKRTRQGLFMQPTDATLNRFKQLEGKIKMGHNQRVASQKVYKARKSESERQRDAEFERQVRAINDSDPNQPPIDHNAIWCDKHDVCVECSTEDHSKCPQSQGGDLH